MDITLGVSGNAVVLRDGTWHTHHSFGRIVSLLASRVTRLKYHAFVANGPVANACDFPLDAANLSVTTWGDWSSSLRALRRPDRLFANYRRFARGCDAFFLRGSTPLLWTMHPLARLRGKPVVQWLAANQVAILRAEQRGMGGVAKRLGITYAYLDRWMTRLSARCAGSHLLANGQDLARAFRTPRTSAIVSTSISESDFHVREDTCAGQDIRLLFVGFIRPEKGIEYLLRAMPLIRTSKTVHLALVGSWAQHPEERKRLDSIITELGLAERVSWAGYAAFGEPLFSQMDRADILVLPTLSEGTPRVLVEARARSLPIVSTNVGGIPSSVTDGEDGLLVPPMNSAGIAAAVSRLVNDTELRRKLIRQGRNRVAELTVESFVEQVIAEIAAANTY